MEQTLIQAQFKKTKLPYLVLIIGLLFIYLLVKECLEWYEYGGTTVVTRYYASGGHDSHWEPYVEQYSSFMDFFWNHCLSNPFESDDIPAPLFLGLAFIVFSFVLWRMMNCCALTVTNSRIIGKASFGKHIEVPINQISTVTQGSFHRLIVGTPFGKKSFWGIQNREEVYNVLMNTITVSQNRNPSQQSVQ